MTRYECHFTDESGSEKIGRSEIINAETPDKAAKIFLDKSEHTNGNILVAWVGGVKVLSLYEITKETATKFNSFLELKKDEGYFLLELNEKLNLQAFFQQLVANMERRKLFPEEADFIRNWFGFKDRELGQNLLAQSEAQKPKNEQGQSPLGKMLLAGVALSTMKLSQDIGAVSDQVENISEGMGFEG